MDLFDWARKRHRAEKSKEYTRRWREKNPEKAKAIVRNNNIRRRGARKEWADKNKEKLAARMRKWRAEHPEEQRARNERQRKAKPWVYAHHAMLRKARILRATPKWADLEEIKEFYKNCPPGHHVDHIIPLVHPRVSGLHVMANLQYLPKLENLRKRNKWPN